MVIKRFSSPLAGTDWDVCSVDHDVNHIVNTVKQPSCSTPMSTRHLKSSLRNRKVKDKARSSKVISSMFRNRSSAGVCMPDPPNCGGDDPCRQAQAVGTRY